MGKINLNMTSTNYNTTKYFPIMLFICLFIVMCSFSDVFGQNCKGFQKRCSSPPKNFKSSSLSRSVTMRKMRKIVVNQIFYGDRTYHISVCGKNKLGKIHYRLIADDEQRSILYDNAIDNFKPDNVFEIQSTMKVIIELTAPHYFEDGSAECAGISVSYKK